MLSFRTTTRLLLSAVVLSSAAAAPAYAADPDTPDQWQRWVTNPGNPLSPRDAWIRSLDFIGPLLFAGGEGEGVYSSPTPLAGWGTKNSGLEDIPGAKAVHEVKTSPDGQVYAATSAGLFRSPAGAGGWTQVGGGEGTRKLNMGGVQSIKFNGPTGTDITVAVAGAAGAGVYNTIDGGAHWDRASGMNMPENVYHLTTGPLQTPLYAAADSGVYASLDFGRSWILTSDGIPPGETTLRVAVSPTNPADLYASTSGNVYRSKNAGITWEDAGGKDGQHLPSGGKRAFLLTPDLSGKFGPARALVGTTQGVYGTLDNGDHWKPMSGRTFAPDAGKRMADQIVWSLNIGFATPVIMAGTQGFGVFNAPILPLGGGAPTISPVADLKAGTELKITNLNETDDNLDNRRYMGFTGTKPYFFAYQWFKCGTDDPGTCTETIPGATGTSYVIPDADANSTKRYAVKVTARNLVSPNPITKTSTLTTDTMVAALPGSAPKPKTGLTLTKNPAGGQPYWDETLSIVPGTWRTEGAPDAIVPDSFKYKWERCLNLTCSTIPNATGSQYKIGKTDIGYFVRGYISGKEGQVTGDFYLAGASSTILNRFPTNTTAPAIVGDAWVGSKLGSAAGGWSGHDMTYERRWFRCEADGLGCNPMAFPTQTASTYVVTNADKGKRLKLEVKAIAKDPNQNRVTTVFSGTTAVITDPPPPPVDPQQPQNPQQPNNPQQPQQPNNPQPPKQLVEIKLPKKLKVGAKLEVPKTVAGYKKLKYQWLRNGKKIKKATKRTYKITKADRGKKISCKVTLTPKSGGKAKEFKTLAVSIPKK